jgi:WD40 repeat protein
MTHEAHEEIVSACPHVRWRLMRFRPRGIGLAAILFVAVLIGFHWILPVSPRAVLQLGNNPRFVNNNEFLGFSPDSSTFVTAKREMGNKIGPVRVWDTQTGTERFAVEEAGSVLETVLLSPDSRLLATRLEKKDADLRLWDIQTGEEIATLRPPPHVKVGFLFRFTPDGQFLVFDDLPSRSGGRYFTRFWNIRARRDAGHIEGEGSYWSLRMGADSHSLVKFGQKDHGEPNRLCFWSTPAEGPPRLLREVHLPATNGPVSPDHSTMASFESLPGAEKATEITLWDLAAGQKRCAFAYDEVDTRIGSLSFSANNRLLVAQSAWGMQHDWHTRTTFWDIASNPMQIGSFSEKPLLSPDGEWLALPLDNGARLYRVAPMRKCLNLAVTDDVGPSYIGFGTKIKWA